MPYSEISDADFQKEAIQQKGKVVVYFWAPWCGPCKSMAPIYSAVANEYESIRFLKMNADNNLEVAGEYSIRALPTFILLEDGKEIDRSVGCMDKSNLIKWIT